jgi:hypothetical protein
MPNYYQGTIGTLSNIIAQEKRANLLKETPQYQQALFGLMEAKRKSLFQETLIQRLSQAQNSQEILDVLSRAGDVQAAKELSGVEQAPIEASRKRLEKVPDIFGKFDIKDPQTALKVVAGDPNALFGVPVRPRSPLVTVKMDPFERARQTGLGSGAAKAEITINSVNAIVGDVNDMFSLFHKIPGAFRGGALQGMTIGEIGKITQSDVRSYYGVRQLTLANIAKKLGGEVGVLTDRDIERITKALPNLIDPPETVEAKERFVYNYMDRRVRAYQKTARLPETGINMPEKYKDPKFNLDKQELWEIESSVPVKGDTTNQIIPEEDLSAEDAYINNLLNPGQ